MRTHFQKISRSLSSQLVLLLLVACGGGGGGGGGSVGSGSTPVVYSGNTSPAVITTLNASAITANVVGGGDAAGIIGGISVQNSSAAPDQKTGPAAIARRLSRSLRDIVAQSIGASGFPQVLAGAIPINETDPCPGGGSITLSGTLSDTGTGTISVTYNSCVVDGVSINGPATMRIDAAGVTLPTVNLFDYTISFAILTLRGVGLSIDAGGSLHIQDPPGTPGTVVETITLNLVERNNLTNVVRQTVNYAIETVDIPPTSYTNKLTGRVFHSVYGFVDVTTTQPFLFQTLDQAFPNSGQMLLTGAPNRRIRGTAVSTMMGRLELDLNGSGFVVGKFAMLKWTDLTGPVGADLGDSDGDGLHNSWETANGLNRNDPGDAATDKDGDGSSNIREYYAGADPSIAGPIPDITPTIVAAPFYGPAADFSAGTSATFVAVGDFNVDGRLDLAVTNGDTDSVSILLGNGSGSFGAANAFPVGDLPVSVAVGDFNKDGKPDLAVANFGGPSVSILLGTGSGSFGAATNLALTATLNPTSVVVGDFNGDGNPDLAVAIGFGFSNSTPGYVSILLGNGDGSFGAPVDFGVGGAPKSVATGDFNGDGKLDLVVGNALSSNVSVLLGDGTGSFGAATSFAAGDRPTSVALGDFNGNGKLDLAVASNTFVINNSNVSVLSGDGAGFFGAAVPFVVDRTAGADLTSVAVGDFNSDGKLDIAVANATGSGSVFVLIGDGAGSFGTTNYFVGVGGQPSSVAIGDFNGDGKPDLAVANANKVSIFLNTSP